MNTPLRATRCRRPGRCQDLQTFKNHTIGITCNECVTNKSRAVLFFFFSAFFFPKYKTDSDSGTAGDNVELSLKSKCTSGCLSVTRAPPPSWPRGEFSRRARVANSKCGPHLPAQLAGLHYCSSELTCGAGAAGGLYPELAYYLTVTFAWESQNGDQPSCQMAPTESGFRAESSWSSTSQVGPFHGWKTRSRGSPIQPVATGWFRPCHVNPGPQTANLALSAELTWTRPWVLMGIRSQSGDLKMSPMCLPGLKMTSLYKGECLWKITS